MRRGIRYTLWAIGGLVVIGGIGNLIDPVEQPTPAATSSVPTSTTTTQPQPSPPPTSPVAPTSAAVPPALASPAPAVASGDGTQIPDRVTCFVDDQDAGRFVLAIASAGAHDFSECATYPRLPEGAGLALPGGDVRCYAQEGEASVAVYSSSRRGDRAAAKDYCDWHGGTAP